MHKCSSCGGKLRRVHRTFLERFGYMAIYACRDCEKEESLPYRYRFHFGRSARCPNCGTFRIVRLKEPDCIDPMYVGFFNFLERIAGGKLFHCRYCRCQFYDRRRLATEGGTAEAVTTPPGTARSDA